jgi:hypothetical protein
VLVPGSVTHPAPLGAAGALAVAAPRPAATATNRAPRREIRNRNVLRGPTGIQVDNPSGARKLRWNLVSAAVPVRQTLSHGG